MRKRRNLWACCLMAVVSCTSRVSVAPVQDRCESVQTVALNDVVAAPSRFTDAPVLVRGRLSAEGNYFSRKSKVFLVDDDGRRLEVTPWLPRSAPPPRGDEQTARTLADYLDQQVELCGVVRVEPASGSTPSPVRFDVRSAKILQRRPAAL